MRIDDVYEYDLDTPIYINDDEKSYFFKDGVIKKGDKFPFGQILAYSLRELNPNYVLNVLRKYNFYNTEITLRNKNSYMVFNKIRENADIFISLALKLDDDEKDRLQKYLLKDCFFKMGLYSFNSVADENLYKSIKDVTVVKRWETFYKVLNSTRGEHSSLNDKNFSTLLSILYEKSDGKILNALKIFLDNPSSLDNTKLMSVKIKHFYEIKPFLKGFNRDEHFFEKSEKVLFENLKDFFYDNCLGDNLEIFSYSDILSETCEVFFKILKSIADNKYYEDIHIKLCEKMYLNNIRLGTINDFFNKNISEKVVNKGDVKSIVENSIKVSTIDSNTIFEISLINFLGIIASTSSTHSLIDVLDDIKSYKKKDVDILVKEEMLKSISIYKDPEEIEDDIRDLKISKTVLFNKIKEKFEPISTFLKKEGLDFAVSLEKNNDDYKLLLITEDFLKDAIVKAFVTIVETPNFNFKNEVHCENVCSILLKDILKQDFVKEQDINRKKTKVKKY